MEPQEDTAFWERQLQTSRRFLTSSQEKTIDKRMLNEGDSLFWERELQSSRRLSNNEETVFWERELQSSRRLL